MDVNTQAFRIVKEATADAPSEKLRRTAAFRKGGLNGGKGRALALPPERRKAIAQKASQARWNPDGRSGSDASAV